MNFLAWFQCRCIGVHCFASGPRCSSVVRALPCSVCCGVVSALQSMDLPCLSRDLNCSALLSLRCSAMVCMSLLRERAAVLWAHLLICVLVAQLVLQCFK